MRRIEQAGARMISVMQLMCELQRDWARKDTVAAFVKVACSVSAKLQKRIAVEIKLIHYPRAPQLLFPPLHRLQSPPSMLRSLARLRAIALIAAAAALACAALTETTLHPRIIDQQPFQMVGIAASTNNTKEAGPDAIIGKQWHRFMSEGLLNKIPNRVDQSIIAVYTDYTSDANGQYTVILGAKVRPIPNPTIPDGMVVKTVPAARYAVFTSERGPVAKVVVETWKQIWAYYQAPQNGQRAYQADFEVYDQRAADPNNAQVDIYVGLK